MRNANIILDVHRTRGAKGLPLERVDKHLFNPELYLRACGKIYRNPGAMTKESTAETVDGMNLQKIHASSTCFNGRDTNGHPFVG